MNNHYFTDQILGDSQPNTLMDAKELTIRYAVHAEEYEILSALEYELWMTRQAEIVCIRTTCVMHDTVIQELQNDGYVPCEPYYDDCGYVYFEKRLETQD